MPTDNMYPTSSAFGGQDLRTTSSSRRRRPDSGSSTSFFKNATNPRIKDSSFVINNIHAPGDNISDPLNKLYDQVATNAILNAGGRADEVKCYPGTREEVIDLIERWMDEDGKDDTAPNMMWLSGPAGAGKSAIVQTIAERCKERGVQAANFFFFRADPTRSTGRPLVATLLYQIFTFIPTARQAIATVLSDNPLLFGASIQDQFNQLLSLPLLHISPSPESPARRPIVILIDGLDECDSEHKSSQRQILQALDYLLAQNNSPFLALVASRTEPQITMAFKQLACPVKSIFLDDRYSPETDIRIFVTGEFDKIKKSHHLAHTLSDHWPSADDIEVIVKKSSGQFIFAATVMRFLSHSSASPMLSLERVKGIAPVAKNSPFAQLDAIYTYILSRAEDQEAVKDLLSLQLLRYALANDCSLSIKRVELPIQTILSTYNPARYSLALIDSCASELTAILQFKEDHMKFYHASFADFLEDQSRSGEYYVDIYAFNAKILPAIWMKAPESSKVATMGINLLVMLKEPTPEITKALRTILPASVMPTYPDWKLPFKICSSFHRLYYRHDVESYKKILRLWVSWYISTGPKARQLNSLSHLPYALTYIRIAKMEHRVIRPLGALFHR